MRKTARLITVLLLTSWAARADQPRSRYLFTSANGAYEARLKDREWRLIDKSSGKELYRFSDYRDRAIWFHTMTLVVSNDGNNVIAIDDYSTQDFRHNPEVLFFFHEGAITKTYKLMELTRPKFLTVSVSHFRWTNYRPGKLAIKDSQLFLSTLNLYNLVLNATTGELLKIEKDKSLTNSALFVYGQVTGLGGSRHKIVVDCVIHGNANERDTIFFDSKNCWEGSGFNESLVIDSGQLVSVQGSLFNACHGETSR